MSHSYDYYEKDGVIYRGPLGSSTVTQKQVEGHWVDDSFDSLPVKFGHHLGVGEADGNLEPEWSKDS
jgi:hypothetical protein